MLIRNIIEGDEAQLYDVFYSSIHEAAKAYYSKEQLDAWAPEKVDLERWKIRMQGIKPYVMLENDTIVAYADLQDNGYIDHFYVSGKYAGLGLGSLLMKHIIQSAIKRKITELTSDVSLSAQNFFLKFGFSIIQRKNVTINGIKLENSLMKLMIKKE
jgi:putative acetyltransferase